MSYYQPHQTDQSRNIGFNYPLSGFISKKRVVCISTIFSSKSIIDMKVKLEANTERYKLKIKFVEIS